MFGVRPIKKKLFAPVDHLLVGKRKRAEANAPTESKAKDGEEKKEKANRTRLASHLEASQTIGGQITRSGGRPCFGGRDIVWHRVHSGA